MQSKIDEEVLCSVRWNCPVGVLTLSWHYEICVKEFEEKCVKKMILSERSEFIIFNIFTKNFSKFRTGLDFFFGSFLLYQDKRNEHNRWGQPQSYSVKSQSEKWLYVKLC
ncbi:MAG: hypothetical protein DRP50_06990 [Thermotoga sp.]|nr:MAG: hypothetical protein DRP50_06990 [Thermotoga sp.]